MLASAKHRMDSHTENCPIQNDNSAKVGKLYLRVWTEIIPSKEGLLIDRRGGLGLLKIPLQPTPFAFTMTSVSENNNVNNFWACAKGNEMMFLRCRHITQNQKVLLYVDQLYFCVSKRTLCSFYPNNSSSSNKSNILLTQTPMCELPKTPCKHFYDTFYFKSLRLLMSLSTLARQMGKRRHRE